MRASAIALFACSFAIVAPALADTRIFSVETDRPGVTITGVTRNGQALPEAGTTGARSFFSIDAGSATVPCSNQLAFTASNGQRLEFVVDLCAHNWQVKLPLGTAQAPPPPPPTTQPAPPAPPGMPQAAPPSITIYTDTAGVGINEVFLDKQPMTIGTRNANGVTIALPAGQGMKCDRDLGLGLTDGRRVARSVNICQPNGLVVVSLNGDGAPASPPVTGPAPVPPPPVAGPVPPQPPAPPGGGPIVIDNMQWTFNARDTDSKATLSYWVPSSDDIAFVAECSPGKGSIDISLWTSSPETREGSSVPVTMTAGTFARTYTATGSGINGITGDSNPEFSTNTDDQLWPELIRGDYLVIQTGSAPAFALSLKGSSAATKPFLAACSPQAALPPPGFPPGGPVGGQVGGDYSCAEEGSLTSQKTDIQSRLIFTNTLQQPVQLFWLDYNGRRQPYLTLGPGETGVQPTFFTHPWLVSDLGGRCVAIYFARRDDAEIMIGQ